MRARLGRASTLFRLMAIGSLVLSVVLAACGESGDGGGAPAY